MLEKGNYLIPTHAAVRALIRPEIQQSMPPDVADRTNKVFEKLLVCHKNAYAKGVKFALGTDAGTPGNPHGTSGEEINWMVEDLGMTPSQSLQAATIEAAKAIKLDGQIGEIKNGLFADFVILESNPLEYIQMLSNSKNIYEVVKDGITMSKNGKITFNTV
ncbi:MAG: amidohydrolase family protein [Candidatus Heimdallarchaeota archaeon]|nr:amidohydrolase family protein [Candidatus Heimdallarchaeota archaeon]MDH5646270.1 amidohydrolase family protein [Candidatus Heimdallarchaeota archaeon]